MKVGLYGALNESPTGPSEVTDGMAYGLAEAGFSVEIVTNGDRTDHRHQSVTVTNVTGRPDSVPGFIRAKRRATSYVAEQSFDVFHSLVGTMRGADVLTCQGLFADIDHLRWSPSAIESPRDFLGANAFSLLKALGVIRSETVVATCPLVARQLSGYLRLGVDEMLPLGVYRRDRVEPTPRSGPARVLVPGRIQPRKGQRWLLEHLDPEADAYQVDLVGGIADETYYRTFADDWSHRVHGFVPRRRLNEFYTEADIVVVPSKHENFSMTAVEAIAKGCTLVITDTCGFATFPAANPENDVFVVDDGATGAERVTSLARDGDFYALEEAAYELSARFTWERIGHEYAALYERSDVRAGGES